jgi:hypothetical protein
MVFMGLNRSWESKKSLRRRFVLRQRSRIDPIVKESKAAHYYQSSAGGSRGYMADMYFAEFLWGQSRLWSRILPNRQP